MVFKVNQERTDISISVSLNNLTVLRYQF